MTSKRITTADGVSVVIAFLICIAGCAFEEKQKQLPSPGYLQDDVSYAPVGPEFKLPSDRAGLKTAREEEKRRAKTKDLPPESDSGIGDGDG